MTEATPGIGPMAPLAAPPAEVEGVPLTVSVVALSGVHIAALEAMHSDALWLENALSVVNSKPVTINKDLRLQIVAAAREPARRLESRLRKALHQARAKAGIKTAVVPKAQP